MSPINHVKSRYIAKSDLRVYYVKTSDTCEHCTYLFLEDALPLLTIDTDTGEACPWPSGAFTVTTTTEMLWRATNCYFSCFNSAQEYLLYLVVGFYHYPSMAGGRPTSCTCKGHHWSMVWYSCCSLRSWLNFFISHENRGICIFDACIFFLLVNITVTPVLE